MNLAAVELKHCHVLPERLDLSCLAFYEPHHGTPEHALLLFAGLSTFQVRSLAFCGHPLLWPQPCPDCLRLLLRLWYSNLQRVRAPQMLLNTFQLESSGARCSHTWC